MCAGSWISGRLRISRGDGHRLLGHEGGIGPQSFDAFIGGVAIYTVCQQRRIKLDEDVVSWDRDPDIRHRTILEITAVQADPAASSRPDCHEMVVGILAIRLIDGCECQADCRRDDTHVCDPVERSSVLTAVMIGIKKERERTRFGFVCTSFSCER